MKNTDISKCIDHMTGKKRFKEQKRGRPALASEGVFQCESLGLRWEQALKGEKESQE